MKRFARNEGMTLIEVMLAISILGMISVMVWGGFAQTARNRARIEADLDRHHVVHAALERMAREISMAYVSSQLNASPSLQVVRTAFVGTDRGDEDRLDFTSFSHERRFRNSHESDQNEISYFIARDPEERSSRVLVRREQHRIDDDPTRGGATQILVHDVEGLEIEYFDPTTSLWTRSWNTQQAAGQPNRLPAQVKIAITIPDWRRRRGTLRFGTRTSIALQYGLNHSTYIR
jgi:general secretion pathway protein J